MRNSDPCIRAFAGAVLLGLCVSTTAHETTSTAHSASDAGARWYWGIAAHALNSEGEHDGDIETDLDYLGPRVYAGRRINEYLSIEAEMGRAVFQGLLWSGRLSTELRMWNTAATALFHIPWENSPVEPFAYAGIGRSFWKYNVTSGAVDFADSASDFYWHVGAGVQVPITARISARVGYRYWRSDMRPQPDRWAVHPDDYYYTRQGIEIGVQWSF